MSRRIINGKHYTFNIYIVKLFFAIILISGYSLPGYAIKNDRKWVIVIDAGHGGKDPGAQGANSSEKHITLAIALKTGEYIEKNIKNATVIYTRKDDRFIEIRDRANIANKAKADLFISIHANWAKSKNILGTETFVMGLAKDQQNLEVAMKENSVILLEEDYTTNYEGFDPKSPESYIMFSLMQNIFQEQSTSLASKIQSQYADRVSRRDRGVKQAGFYVLFMTTMPSVLTETGFITHPAEEKFLTSKEGQDYLASAIYRACKEYINEIDSKSSSLPEKAPDTEILTDITAQTDEVIFMVQIASSSTKTGIEPTNFNGLKDIMEIPSNERYRYASGRFKEYPDAAEHRKILESLYPDAFVIAVKNNKILPLQEALEQKTNK
jgi:N-acetylmuramoyl-L-alanine amidase